MVKQVVTTSSDNISQSQQSHHIVIRCTLSNQFDVFLCCSTYATDNRVLNAFFTTLQQIETQNFTHYQTQHPLLSSHYPAAQHIVAPFNNNRPRNHAKRTDANQISAPTKVQPKPACCGKHNFPVRFARTLLDTRAANVTSARHKSLRPTSFVCPLFRVV